MSPLLPPAAVPSGDPHGQRVKISVIITNYNYASFVRMAIESVLSQTYPNIECIVVDDGSTDGSREVIAGYPSLKTLFQTNSGQARAAKAGLELATGSIVVFLDADDFLHPDACQTVAALWQPDMSALFFRLQIVEGETATNRTWPDKPFLQGDAAAFALRFGFLPSAPTSGNAFARDHVARVFNMARGLDKNSFDTALTIAAPFTGRVATSDAVLGSYRIHASNLTSYGQRQTLRNVKLGLYYAYHAQQTARELAAAKGLPLPAWDHLAGPYNLKYYVLVRDFTCPDIEIPPRNALACALESARAFAAYAGLPLPKRLANIGAVYAFAIMPRRLRRWVCQRFYAIDIRL